MRTRIGQDDQQGQAKNIKKAGKVIGGNVNKALSHTLWEMNVKTVTKGTFSEEKEMFHRNVMQSLLKQTSGSCTCDDQSVDKQKDQSEVTGPA